ncbi:copper chaperone PCu(A)C [Streptomyces sp. NPDC058373]|uniref:copper chaperone PCu(A)C n=1 Tax=Streptomyces sp. NPDC058373 TaxID=3346465 RepID=UPI0036694C13
MRRRWLISGALALVAATSLAACSDAGDEASGAPELAVTGAFMPQPVNADMAAGFFTVTNKGGADRLTSVTSPSAERVTLHSTEDGTMREQDAFEVPADGTLDFSRGGNHLMFEELPERPAVGDSVEVTLHFSESGEIEVSLPVKEATYNPAKASGPGHGTAHPADRRTAEAHHGTVRS